MSRDLATREARARAGRIREGMRNYLSTLVDVKTAWDARDWATLGYDSWESYIEGEYSVGRLRVSPEHRQKAIVELRLAGMSTRAIAAATGLGKSTVGRGLTEPGVPDGTPGEVTGRDGKTYPSTKPGRPESVTEPPKPDAPDAVPPTELTSAEPSDNGDARRSAELDAAIENTDVRFRRNFSAAMRKAAEVWSFDPDRIAEVYAADFDQSIGRTFLQEMTAFCQRVEQAHRQRPGLRVVNGGRR